MTGSERRSRRFSVGLVVGVVLAVVALLGAELTARWLEPAMYGRDAGAAPEAVRKSDQLADRRPEVLAMGDSSMDAGFDPTVFAASSRAFDAPYNASLVGARFPTQKLWMTQEVLSRSTPSLVLQSVGPVLTMSTDGSIDQSVYDSILNQSVRSLDDSPGQRLERLASSSSALVRNRSTLRSPQETWLAFERRRNGEGPPLRAGNPIGYWERFLSPDGQNTAYRVGVADPVAPSGLVSGLQQVMAGDVDLGPVDQLLATYADQGLAVVVVVPPTALDVLAANGIDTNRWRAATAELVDHVRARGFPVVDFTEAGYDRRLFFDPLHLNGEGSKRFSIELAAKVDQLCRTTAALRCSA